MDEPGTDRSAEIQIGEESPDDIFGLLCSWNGDIRNHQWEPAIP